MLTGSRRGRVSELSGAGYSFFNFASFGKLWWHPMGASSEFIPECELDTVSLVLSGAE